MNEIHVYIQGYFRPATLANNFVPTLVRPYTIVFKEIVVCQMWNSPSLKIARKKGGRKGRKKKPGVDISLYTVQYYPCHKKNLTRTQANTNNEYSSSIPRGMVLSDQFVCTNFRLRYGSLKSQSIHYVMVFIRYHRLVN